MLRLGLLSSGCSSETNSCYTNGPISNDKLPSMEAVCTHSYNLHAEISRNLFVCRKEGAGGKLGGLDEGFGRLLQKCSNLYMLKVPGNALSSETKRLWQGQRHRQGVLLCHVYTKKSRSTLPNQDPESGSWVHDLKSPFMGLLIIKVLS